MLQTHLQHVSSLLPNQPWKGFHVDIPADQFRSSYLSRELLRKLSSSQDVDRLTTECIERYVSTEARIKVVNDKLRSVRVPGSIDPVVHLLLEMQRKVEQIIGASPVFDNIFNSAGWGPGSTATLKARSSTVDRKITEQRLGVSSRCRRYAVYAMSHDRAWMAARIPNVEGPCCPLRSEFASCESGRFTTVEKDASKRRAIDVQPTLNLFFQKGAGKEIRRLLRRWGVNLDDQSKNQRLARSACDMLYATLDLSEASDSVSHELVKWILPPDWYDLLNDLRTHSICLPDNSTMKTAKFSSMGNGFTFELESLIFYSLLLVIKERHECVDPISVYGDDLICSQRIAPHVVDALISVGFLINQDKSFVSGFFFESCGKHYYKGVDVTPAYQKDPSSDCPALIRFSNRIARWGLLPGSGGTYFDSAALPLLEYLQGIAKMAYNGCTVKRKAHRDIPIQPFGCEGDDGLITFGDWSTDINGILRLRAIRFVPTKRGASEAALYAERLRTSDGTVLPCPTAYMGLVTLRKEGYYCEGEKRIYFPSSVVPVVI